MPRQPSQHYQPTHLSGQNVSAGYHNLPYFEQLCRTDDDDDDDDEDDDDEDDDDDDDDGGDDDGGDDDDDAEFNVGRDKLSSLARSASRNFRLASCLAARSCKYLYDGRPPCASGE